jgi:hypothetical protein
MISNPGQPTMSGLPTWGLNRGLTIHHCKNPACYEILHRTDLDKFFGISRQWKMNEIWNMDCTEQIQKVSHLVAV